MIIRTLAVLCLCLITLWASANQTDHPLISRYPGAEIKDWRYTEYERVELPSGPVGEEGRLDVDSLVGNFTGITYEIEGVSTLKVFENYRKALQNVGSTMVSVCRLAECGDKDHGLLDLASGVLGYVGNYFNKPYYIRAKLDSPKGDIQIGLFIGGFDGDVQVQQIVVEEVPLQNGLIDVNDGYIKDPVESAPPIDQRTSREKAQDHPMIARFPGASLSRARNIEYEKIALPVSRLGSEGVAPVELNFTGDIHQYTYEVEGVSTLKVYQNYLRAAKNLGFSVKFSCERRACGGEQESIELAERLAVDHDVENFYRKPYYFVATRDTAQGRIAIAVYVGGFEGDAWIQQVIVEEKGAETDLVKVNADILYEKIEQTGKALIYGIYFDIDSATIKPKSDEALQAISDLLGSHPKLNLYVVGHTDDTGDSDYNLTLSSRRAASVVNALKTKYDVDSDRLRPAGVGPYSPVSDNGSDSGRRLNRRVELVRRL
ncbi:OmpA family protein [Marinobacter sp. NFXS9]|uniref:OmpA family protein n=1 Tax=Marinobacter sp. NFXS9 TaxID=2818433 RepID=UPI0032DE6ABB